MAPRSSPTTARPFEPFLSVRILLADNAGRGRIWIRVRDGSLPARSNQIYEGSAKSARKRLWSRAARFYKSVTLRLGHFQII